MKNKDYQIYPKCADVKQSNNGVDIKIYLSVKKAVFNVLQKHCAHFLELEYWTEFKMANKKNCANQIVVSKMWTWGELNESNLTNESPSTKAWKMFNDTRDFIKDLTMIYKEEVKEELFNQIIG